MVVLVTETLQVLPNREGWTRGSQGSWTGGVIDERSTAVATLKGLGFAGWLEMRRKKRASLKSVRTDDMNDEIFTCLSDVKEDMGSTTSLTHCRMTARSRLLAWRRENGEVTLTRLSWGSA